jgi:hypothetical protein
VPRKERKRKDGCESESRSRVSNIHPCELRLGHSTASHTHSLHLHAPHRLHSTDRPNHQLSVCHAALGRPSQRQTTSMCRSDDPPPLAMNPPLLPFASERAAAITEPRYFAFTESRHEVVVRTGTHSAVRAVSTEFHQASPPLAPATRAGLPKPGTVSASSSSFALPFPSS